MRNTKPFPRLLHSRSSIGPRLKIPRLFAGFIAVMETLSPAYLSAIAVQIGGLSAFLGGFAAAFLGTLLALARRDRAGSFSIGFAVTAAVAFIVTVVASTLLVAVLHPEAPHTAASPMSPSIGRAVMGLSFFVGLLALLGSIALSGWSRSKTTGWVTSVAAAIGVLLVGWILVSVR